MFKGGIENLISEQRKSQKQEDLKKYMKNMEKKNYSCEDYLKRIPGKSFYKQNV